MTTADEPSPRGSATARHCRIGPAPLDAGAIPPQELEIIVLAVAGQEKVDDHVGKIEEQPPGIPVPLDADTQDSILAKLPS